jgi:hypothetical protein
MFHFAGGIHQVSVGEVNQCMWGAWLHNDIAIQGGPGSSGAAVIGKWFDHIQGCGVSIYRQIHQDWGTSVERRLISFAHFANPGATLDCISAPYLYDSNFYVSSSAHLSESGYEFLRWSLAYAGHGNDHPGLKMFEVQENHSNHHIIPRGDLLYLWDYVYDVPTYQPVTDRLKEAIRLQVIAESLNAKRRKTPFNSQERANFLYNEQLKVYGQLRQHLNELCVTYYDRYGRYQSVNGPIGFYWAEWNLFKGWNSHHRSDDPVRDGEDRSEKNKPHGFNKGLWECLKNPKTGLYHGIQSLKQSTLSGVPNISLLSQLDESVVKIIELWIRLPKHHKIIHPFNPDEWESQKGLYRVR